MQKVIVVFIAIVIFQGLVSAQKPDSKPKQVTAILGAFPAEIKLLADSLKEKKEITLQGIKFMTGKLKGKEVVIAETGIGKVNAAMTTALTIALFHPKNILFSGIAGGLNPDLQPGDIVIAEKTTYHDYHSVTLDAQSKPTNQTINPITKQFNPEFFQSDKILLEKAQKVSATVSFMKISEEHRIPKVVTGTIVTGDIFVNSKEIVEKLRRDYQADATEMEGAAVAQVCYEQNIPCLIIRSLSDKADDNARKDMLSFYKTAAANSAKLVTAIVAGL